MSSKKEVIIIGAGVIGCSIAYHLAKQGVPSQVIEMDSIANRASGKSWAVWSYPARFIAIEGQPTEQFFSMPVGSVCPWLQLLWVGYHKLPDVAPELKELGGIDVEYSELPFIRVAFTEDEEKNFKALLSFLREHGYYEGYWMEESDLKSLYPDINPLARGGTVLPYLQVEPYRYTLGLAQAAEKMGAIFRQGEAVDFRHQGSKITSVTLATGTEVEGDVFVVAMGPWSSRGASCLGREMPILVSREQCLRMEMPKNFPPYALASSAGQVIIPKVDGSVILGHAGTADLQQSFDVSLITEKVKMALIEDAIEILPSLSEAKLVEHRGNFEGWSPPPNRIQPVIGQMPDWDNAYVATRFGTLGMLMSLGTGMAMAELIINEGKLPARFKTMMEVLSPAKIFGQD